MNRRLLVASLLTALVMAPGAVAQEGHPLVGSWHGSWTVPGAAQRDLTVVVDYAADGSDVAGVANPGFDNAPLHNLRLTIPKPTDWHASFTVELKDRTGATTRYVADGTLAKLGSDRRTLTGSWTAGTAKGTFTLTRDRDYSR